MTLDERLMYLATVQQSHDDQIAKLVEQGAVNSNQIAILTERTIQAMDAINRLGRIAGIHEDSLDNLENQRPS